MDWIPFIFIFLLFLCMAGIIVFLLRQLDRLQNKLMARDYTEFAVHNREKPMGKGGNYLQDSIAKAYKNHRTLAKERIEFDDDEG